MSYTERTKSSQNVYSGRILDISKDTAVLDNGQEVTREVVNHSGGVCVLAFTENREIFLVEQYRYGVKKTLFELPAGKLEKNEDPLVCAKRELIEETGYEAGNINFMSKMYPTPAYCSEVIHMYCAENLIKREQKLDEDEFLTVFTMPFDEALKKAVSGEFEDSKTRCAIMAYALKKLPH